ncbi:type II toxin-antitoxin system VapC family toxin [Limnospira fusiformis]|uniref:type II toxin-antitoxin system VapC family toxin n=1 Tax=Limnospira fusiformis TaxID=54297 RepID=UPI000DC23664|nr:PIN domain nuclease [Arthrospira sp. O9.13F]RAQ39449.1 PIN domain nuclease [Arthrospira sp. O9.13F]
MIILDTHAWLWWVNESDKLAPHAQDVIQGAEQIGVCAISCWEVGMLVAKGRLGLSVDVEVWIELALQRRKVTLLPLTPKIAVLATRLPGGFHGDPADRLIVASCLVNQAALISKDEKIQEWSYLEVIW